MAGLLKVKGLPLQPTIRFTGTLKHDDEHIPSKKRKLEVKATEEIPTEESDRKSALEKLIIFLNQEYPVYKTYREGRKYQYTTVQYKILDPKYILEPFTDAI